MWFHSRFLFIIPLPYDLKSIMKPDTFYSIIIHTVTVKTKNPLPPSLKPTSTSPSISPLSRLLSLNPLPLPFIPFLRYLIYFLICLNAEKN